MKTYQRLSGRFFLFGAIECYVQFIKVNVNQAATFIFPNEMSFQLYRIY